MTHAAIPAAAVLQVQRRGPASRCVTTARGGVGGSRVTVVRGHVDGALAAPPHEAVTSCRPAAGLAASAVSRLPA